MQGERERCIKAGMDAYISKPFDRKEFLGVISKVVAQQAAAGAART